MQTKIITVGLGERSYPISIGSGILSTIGKQIRSLHVGSRYAIISDDTVANLYGTVVLDSLKQAGVECELITFPAGEEQKHLQTVTGLAREMTRRGYDRSDAVIALGGGVVGDVAGFLASIYMRGIPFLQIPTTLLAQVDSSVGGKTGVDIPEGKNLVGTFYQPKAVYIDIDVLSTLPEKQFFGGLAEVIKYGMIIDSDFFSFLREEQTAIMQHSPDTLVSMITTCCEIKAKVVEQDEREGGLRRILNFGHTIGHAVEAASGFKLIHGYAVAIGMLAASELAVLHGCADKTTVAELQEILDAYGLPTTIPASLDRTVIHNYLLADKKVVSGRIFFVLPEAVGRVIITDQVNREHLDTVISKKS